MWTCNGQEAMHARKLDHATQEHLLPFVYGQDHCVTQKHKSSTLEP